MENTTQLQVDKKYRVTKDGITIDFYPTNINRQNDLCNIFTVYPEAGVFLDLRVSKIEQSNPELVN